MAFTRIKAALDPSRIDDASACRYSRSLLGLEKYGWVAAQTEG